MTHKIHDRLPDGFGFANELQVKAFEATGSVNGASKVCTALDWMAEPKLAIRLRPPRSYDDIDRPLIGVAVRQEGITRGADAVAWYIREYNAGWAAVKRERKSGETSPTWENGSGSHAWDDGYLDASADRLKWHSTYCENHDACGEG